jgi:hypothetical protein
MQKHLIRYCVCYIIPPFYILVIYSMSWFTQVSNPPPALCTGVVHWAACPSCCSGTRFAFFLQSAWKWVFVILPRLPLGRTSFHFSSDGQYFISSGFPDSLVCGKLTSIESPWPLHHIVGKRLMLLQEGVSILTWIEYYRRCRYHN